jgi:hypothetical protein
VQDLRPIRQCKWEWLGVTTGESNLYEPKQFERAMRSWLTIGGGGGLETVAAPSQHTTKGFLTLHPFPGRRGVPLRLFLKGTISKSHSADNCLHDYSPFPLFISRPCDRNTRKLPPHSPPSRRLPFRSNSRQTNSFRFSTPPDFDVTNRAPHTFTPAVPPFKRFDLPEKQPPLPMPNHRLSPAR